MKSISKTILISHETQLLFGRLIEMKIAVIGASRGVGKVLLEIAVAAGHQVTVLARYPEKIKADSSLVKIVQGDVLSAESVAQAVNGQEGVCSCIGVPITFKPVSLFSRGMANIIEAMKKIPGQKLVAITGIGAGDSKGHGGFLYDKIFNPLFLKTIYADKDREELLIRKSELDWLIVRPAGLTNGPRTGKYSVFHNLEGVTSRRISRRDVADFILKELEQPTQFGTTPLISY